MKKDAAHSFWSSLTLAGILSGALGFVVAFGLQRLGALEVGAPPGFFLAAQAAECRPERFEQLIYLLMISQLPVFFLLTLCAGCARGVVARVEAGSLGVPALILLFVAFMWHRAHFDHFDLSSVGVFMAVAASGLWVVAKVEAWGRVPQGLGCAALAIILTALSLLPSLQTEGSLLLGSDHIYSHFSYALGEFAAVLNGRTPWVDFFPQYQNLLAYALAPILGAVGLSVASYSATMVMLSGLGFGAIYAGLARVERTPVRTLLSFIPVLAVSFIPVTQSGTMFRTNPYTYYAMGPLRYLGPFVVFALLAWSLRTRDPKGSRWERWQDWLLPLGASLAALNNLDFGFPALVGAFLARVAFERRPVQEAARFCTALALVVAAWALFSRWRGGTWPEPLWEFQKVYGVFGFGMLPMSFIGFHWVVYAITMGGLLAGIARAWRRPGDARGAALIFAAVFSFGAGMYYVGRTHHDSLLAVLAGPALVASLWIGGVRDAWLEGMRESRFKLFLALFGYGALLTPLASFPGPLDQVRRLGLHDLTLTERHDAQESLIRAHAAPGAHVVICYPYGSLLALRAGVDNRFPFVQEGSLILVSQVDRVIEAIQRDSVHAAFGNFPAELQTRLQALGFQRVGAVSRPTVTDFEVWKR